MRRLNTLAPICLGILLLITCSSSSHAAFILDTFANLAKPEFTVYYTNGVNPVNVDFKTTDHQVSIDGNHGDVFFANWDMRIENINSFGGSDFIDWDIAGGNVTLDGSGYWEHLAKGTGVLSGSRMLSNGNYQAYVRSYLDAERLSDHTSSYNHLQIWKDFTVETG